MDRIVMKNMNLFVLLALVMLTACAKDTNLGEDKDLTHDTIYASIENKEDSRVQIDENVKTVWTEGDEITIFGDGQYARYKFDGKTGDRVGSFTKSMSFVV